MRFRSAQPDIERLENENHKFQADANNDSRNIQECQQKLKDSEKRMRVLQVECDNMKKELRESIEEASGVNGKSRQQLEASQFECEQLVTRCHDLETQIAQHQREQEVTVKSFEVELVARRVQVRELKTQIFQVNHQADECIQKMRSEIESLQKEVDGKESELGEMQDKMHQMQNFYDDLEQR